MLSIVLYNKYTIYLSKVFFKFNKCYLINNDVLTTRTPFGILKTLKITMSLLKLLQKTLIINIILNNSLYQKN